MTPNAKRAGLARTLYRGAMLGRNVGFLPGLRTEISLNFNRPSKGAVTKVTVPGIKGPVHIRPGTSDEPTFRQIFTEQAYALDRISRFRTIVARYDEMTKQGKTPLIVDCGANIGLSSVWFARMMPKAKVIAIEPSPDNFKMVVANTAPYPNIVPVNGAIWNEPSTLEIANPDAEYWAIQVTKSASGAGPKTSSVRAYTMGEILEMAGLDEILIAKIDIEGAEAALFESNTAWIDRTSLIIIELHDWMAEGTSAGFLREIAKRKVHLRQRGENLLAFLG